MFDRLFKTEASEKEKHADEVIKLLEDSSTLKALKNEQQEKLQNERRAALDRIEAAERERDEILPPLYQSLEAARLHIEEIEAKFKADMKAACRDRDDKDYKHSREKFRLDNSIERDRRLLRDTAAPELDEFRRWLLAEDDKSRHAFNVMIGVKTLPFGAARVVESNSTAISQRRSAIKKAMDRVEEMRFELIEDLTGEIATLKESIPPDSYPTERSEAPIPKPEPYERYSDNHGADQPKYVEEPRINWS